MDNDNIGVHPECVDIYLYAAPAFALGCQSWVPQSIAPQSLAIGPVNQYLGRWWTGEWRERRGRDKRRTENDEREDGSARRAPTLLEINDRRISRLIIILASTSSLFSLLLSVSRKYYVRSGRVEEARVCITSLEDNPVSLLRSSLQSLMFPQLSCTLSLLLPRH